MEPVLKSCDGVKINKQYCPYSKNAIANKSQQYSAVRCCVQWDVPRFAFWHQPAKGAAFSWSTCRKIQLKKPEKE